MYSSVVQFIRHYLYYSLPATQALFIHRQFIAYFYGYCRLIYTALPAFPNSLLTTHYSPYLSSSFIFIAFVHIIFKFYLSIVIFLGKEKGKRKKRNEYKVAFQQIQVQSCSIKLYHLKYNIALQGLPSGCIHYFMHKHYPSP
jgi:hypothetical protein